MTCWWSLCNSNEGAVAVPKLPGLGIDVDRDKLATYCISSTWLVA